METKEMIIKTNDLSFKIGEKQILSNLNLEVPKGSIYGFLGPNGAGKTTCIKILVNLLKTGAGKVELFGKDITKNRIEILSHIGSFIEQPSLFGHLTGRENLDVARRAYGLDKSRIDDVLGIVDMKQDANRKVKQYSLGMKQRIAIALALLNDPELLILDEPTNGLDPSGIHEIRELLIRLNHETGKTIFISSHLLPEIQKLSTHVGILNHGKLLFHGALSELENVNSSNLKIEVNKVDEAARFLAQQAIKIASTNSTSFQVVINNSSDIAKVNKLLVNEGFDIYGLSSTKSDLEDVFLNLTQNEDK